MIDITQVKYDLVLLAPDGQRYHLFEPQRELSWEEQPEELAVRLQFRVQNVDRQGKWLHQQLALCSQLYLFSDWGVGWTEIFRGKNWNTDMLSDPLGNLNLTVYDQLRYLKQNNDDRYYGQGTTGATIIRDIATDWNIPVSRIDGPNVGLSKQVIRGKDLASIIINALKESKRKGGGKYIIRSRQDKVEVVKAGQNTPVYHLGSDDNVQQVRDQQDIEELVTRVRIVGTASEDELRPYISQIDGRTEFGIMQEIVQESDTEDSKADEEARQILDERGKPNKKRTVSAPDLPFLRRGDKVHITAGTLNGYYLVEGIHHNANNRTMELEVEDI